MRSTALVGLSLALAAGGCAHAPLVPQIPISGQVGCYQVRLTGSPDLDLPLWFREHVPGQVALTAEPDEQYAEDPGWRLATLGTENKVATQALRDGIWRPFELGGAHIRFGDGFSGVGVRLKVAEPGFEGEARTFSDIGDHWFHTPVRLERIPCPRPPTIIQRRGVL